MCLSSGVQNYSIQPLVSSHFVGDRPVHNLCTGRPPTECDDTRCCIIQFCSPDDEYMCSKHVEAWNKLIIKFSASIWLILINKYIEMHGQQNIKKYIDVVVYCRYIIHYTNLLIHNGMASVKFKLSYYELSCSEL